MAFQRQCSWFVRRVCQYLAENQNGSLGLACKVQDRRGRWRETVDHSRFHAVLEQHREARTTDNLGVQLMEALYTAIRGQIPEDRPHDQLHFSIHAHGFQHAFRSANIRVQDFMTRDRYVDELLDTLAGKLNSNEEFI